MGACVWWLSRGDLCTGHFTGHCTICDEFLHKYRSYVPFQKIFSATFSPKSKIQNQHKTKLISISTAAATTYRVIITHPYHYQQLRLSSLLLSILNAHHKLWSIICNIPRLPQKILLDRDKLKIVSSEVNKIHQVDFNTTTAFNTVIIFCIEFCGSGTVRSIPYWCK